MYSSTFDFPLQFYLLWIVSIRALWSASMLFITRPPQRRHSFAVQIYPDNPRTRKSSPDPTGTTSQTSSLSSLARCALMTFRALIGVNRRVRTWLSYISDAIVPDSANCTRFAKRPRPQHPAVRERHYRVHSRVIRASTRRVMGK